MKIAYIISSLDIGGAQTMLLQIIKELRTKKNVTIKVFVKNKNPNNFISKALEEMNIDVCYLKKEKNTLFSKISMTKVFYKQMNIFDPNIIHSHLENNISLLYALFKKKKIVVTIHSWPSRFVNKKVKRLYLKLIQKDLIKIVCCAKCVQQELQKLISVSNKKITTIYNPIDLSKYEHKKIHNDVFRLINVGRLSYIKNHDLLIDAFNIALKKDNNLELQIVGDGELENELKEKAKKLGISNKICFLGSRDDIQVLLSESDAFILTSKSECCPMVVLEAMASEIPIVSTNVGGVSEIMGESGILCEENENSIAEAIMTIKNDTLKYKKFQKNEKEKVKLFNCHIIADRYYELYSNYLLENGGD